jgi:hypothetical protein
MFIRDSNNTALNFLTFYVLPIKNRFLLNPNTDGQIEYGTNTPSASNKVVGVFSGIQAAVSLASEVGWLICLFYFQLIFITICAI